MFFFDVPLLEQITILYTLAVNVVTCFFFGIDKLQAQLGKRRTPESALWFLCILGGSLGALVGMHFFRHKTKKISFQFVLSLILLIQVGLLMLFFYK